MASFTPYGIYTYVRKKILEVYPGSKYGDTVIAELYFDGIDVH